MKTLTKIKDVGRAIEQDVGGASEQDVGGVGEQDEGGAVPVFQKEVSRDYTTTQLLHTNTVSSA